MWSNPHSFFMSSKKSLRREFGFPSDAIIVFFDLEYYVPSSSRNDQTFGLVYDPDASGQFLIGGSHVTFRVSELGNDDPFREMKSFWGRCIEDERKAVLAFYNVLKKALKLNKSNQPYFSPVLCGVGITHSDWPVLLHLFVKHEIIRNDEVFRFQNQFRILDLQIVSIPFFNSNYPLLYPKKKADLMQKFLKEKPMKDGCSVWSMFDQGEFEKIALRNDLEVRQAVQIYRRLFTHSKELLGYKNNWLKLQRALEKKSNEGYVG